MAGAKYITSAVSSAERPAPEAQPRNAALALIKGGEALQRLVQVHQIQVLAAGAGAQRVSFEERRHPLLIVKADGSIWRYKPTVYQVIDGRQKNRLATFHIIGKDRVSLKVEKVDSSAPLVVGPVSARNGNS